MLEKASSILEPPASQIKNPIHPRAKASQAPESADASDEINKLITSMVRQNIPHTFTEDKDWGGQKERWDGIKFRREGLRIETKRRKKLVNHGTWKKYSASLLNPDQEFAIEVKNMHETPDEKVAFDVHFSAHLKVDGRQSKWVKGVQLYSIGFDGHTKVRLVVSIELGVSMDVNRFPPDMVFNPVAKTADLVVDEFRLDRIGKAGGEFTQQVSRGLRSTLDKKVAEKEHKLVEKINKQISKNQGKLRLSIADAMKSKWSKAARSFVPKKVQDAIGDN